jgi:spore germination protein GerM
MSRRPPRPAAAALATVTLLLAAAALAGCGRRPGAAPPPPGAEPATPAAAPAPLPVDLYFPGDDGMLYRERRELTVADDAEAQIRALVGELLAGPQTAGLLAPFPAGVELADVHLGPDGVAYVDLASPGGGEPPAAGSGLEMQMVYSVVDTVALNVAGARRVVLLWNGTQRRSFAGHLDTSHPLAPSPALVAR